MGPVDGVIPQRTTQYQDDVAIKATDCSQTQSCLSLLLVSCTLQSDSLMHYGSCDLCHSHAATELCLLVRLIMQNCISY